MYGVVFEVEALNMSKSEHFVDDIPCKGKFVMAEC